jgi:transcriptional regulator with XRE-family HTH domain
MAAKFDVDAEKIRRLRLERAWPQDHLADVSGLSYCTIQRIEATGKAGMESIRALANAFEIDSSELLRPVPKVSDGRSLKAKSDVPRFLVRITSGADLFAILGGAHAGSVENEELKSEAEVEIVGSFLQEMSDLGEMWSELEPGERVRQVFEFTQKLKELDDAGFVVFGIREKKAFHVADKIIPDWNVAIIRVLRSTNPAIRDI